MARSLQQRVDYSGPVSVPIPVTGIFPSVPSSHVCARSPPGGKTREASAELEGSFPCATCLQARWRSPQAELFHLSRNYLGFFFHCPGLKTGRTRCISLAARSRSPAPPPRPPSISSWEARFFLLPATTATIGSLGRDGDALILIGRYNWSCSRSRTRWCVGELPIRWEELRETTLMPLCFVLSSPLRKCVCLRRVSFVPRHKILGCRHLELLSDRAHRKEECTWKK